MGLNLDLTMMLDVPRTSTCTNCNKSFDNNYDVYDIECGFPNNKRGQWKLHNYCPFCETEFYEYFVIGVKQYGY
jgi:hypothetical protein